MLTIAIAADHIRRNLFNKFKNTKLIHQTPLEVGGEKISQDPFKVKEVEISELILRVKKAKKDWYKREKQYYFQLSCTIAMIISAAIIAACAFANNNPLCISISMILLGLQCAFLIIDTIVEKIIDSAQDNINHVHQTCQTFSRTQKLIIFTLLTVISIPWGIGELSIYQASCDYHALGSMLTWSPSLLTILLIIMSLLLVALAVYEIFNTRSIYNRDFGLYVAMKEFNTAFNLEEIGRGPISKFLVYMNAEIRNADNTPLTGEKAEVFFKAICYAIVGIDKLNTQDNHAELLNLIEKYKDAIERNKTRHTETTGNKEPVEYVEYKEVGLYNLIGEFQAINRDLDLATAAVIPNIISTTAETREPSPTTMDVKSSEAITEVNLCPTYSPSLASM